MITFSVNHIHNGCLNYEVESGETLDLKGIGKYVEIKSIFITLKNIDKNTRYTLLNYEEICELLLLENLALLFCDIEDISFVEKLHNLIFFNMSFNKIKDLHPLKGKKLKNLWLHNNKITDISVIKDVIPFLELVMLTENDIEDYSILSSAENLKTCCVNECDSAYRTLSKTSVNKINGRDAKDVFYEWKLNNLINSIDDR